MADHVLKVTIGVIQYSSHYDTTVLDIIMRN